MGKGRGGEGGREGRGGEGEGEGNRRERGRGGERRGKGRYQQISFREGVASLVPRPSSPRIYLVVM